MWCGRTADTSSTETDSDIDLPEPEDAPIDTTAAGAAGKSMCAGSMRAPPRCGAVRARARVCTR
ncbi:hypothetical protein EON68_04930 [archaeon]|nr:MAG: hypothetical protein EON68_04930 [archaeon]